MPEGRSLYDEDFVRWSEEQAAAIRSAASSGTNLPLDWENLAEEIDSLGKSQRSELASRTRTLVEHLLKLACSAATEPRHGWRETIRRTRDEVEDLLETSPSLLRERGAILERVRSKTARNVAQSLEDLGESAAGVKARLHGGDFSVDQVFGDWMPDDAGGAPPT
ncbi:DUF29 domain-containing protein [uncultured Enterovirga sp.]|uniref:DUF29 domain-containing protein n=1 Tax=uncultured Enterovirga sp. TaxID=2026352 RepID=UPI0035CB2168